MRKFRSAAMAFPLAVLVFATVGVLAPLSVAAAPCATSTSGGVTTLTFCFTGAAQSWTVPAGVHSAKFTVLGAAGGAGANNGQVPTAGGLGGRAVATLAITPGATITIVVGGHGGTPPAPDGCPNPSVGGAGGFNGGAIGGGATGNNCAGSGGGGASDVRIGGSRMVVGGGGGGGSLAFAGGAGGGTVGVNGAGTVPSFGGGGGGTQSAGGAFGNGDQDGSPGALGVGGAGGTNCGEGGGGGGGGYYGGGGGGAAECGSGGGGGGGSARLAFGAVLAAGVRAGDGLVIVSFTTPLPAASASEPSIPWLPIGGLLIGIVLVGFGMRRRRATA